MKILKSRAVTSGWIAAILCGIVSVTGASSATAAVTYINGTVTGITGTAVRMISYRPQEHSWRTSDGAIHLMINQGDLSPGNSLALYSSFDGGASWQQMLTLSGTDDFSISDGTLANIGGTQYLLLVYSTAQSTGTILYTAFAYNPTSRIWTRQSTQTVFSQANFIGSNPAIAADSAGAYWCGFTVENLTTQQYQLQMAYRAPKTTQWTNTGLVFGPTTASLQHSARPVSYPGGVGMVYQVGQTMYWAYRLTGWPITQSWVGSTLFTGLPPYTQDPYDSHYSIVSDSGGNLHLAFITNKQLMYMRYWASTGTWGAPRALTSSTIQAAYPQVGIAGGNVMVAVNDLQSILMLQSKDDGTTFTATQALVHPAPASGSSLYYGNPRVEMPAYSTSPVPVWQQFVDGSTQELLFFQVPVVR